jgi:L-idonate 5-dehydrogenase
MDIKDAVLEKARAVGADRTINVASDLSALSAYSANKGYFDAQFEASGNESAVRSGLEGCWCINPSGVKRRTDSEV